jgi:hypothetical protein
MLHGQLLMTMMWNCLHGRLLVQATKPRGSFDPIQRCRWHLLPLVLLVLLTPHKHSRVITAHGKLLTACMIIPLPTPLLQGGLAARWHPMLLLLKGTSSQGLCWGLPNFCS